MKIAIGEIFVAADIFYGQGNKDKWESVPADKLYSRMIASNAPRAYLALERGEIINGDFENFMAFNNDRNIIWENGDVESADLPTRIFDGTIRRAQLS